MGGLERKRRYAIAAVFDNESIFSSTYVDPDFDKVNDEALTDEGLDHLNRRIYASRSSSSRR